MRKATTTKLYMIKYVGRLFKAVRVQSLNILIRGAPRDYKKILRAFLRTFNEKTRKVHDTTVNYVFLTNAFIPSMSRRAIKKRVAKRIHLQR